MKPHLKILRLCTAVVTLSFLSLLSLPTTASASSDASSTQVGGLLFSHWGMDLSKDAEEANAFEIKRVYTTIKHAINDDLSMRVTTDVGTVQNSDDTKMRLYLKYAYLEWKGFAPGMKLRFGAAGTPFVDDSSKFTGLRYISKALADRNKLMSTSDLGLHVMGKHLDGALSWQLSAMNGEGYGSPEDSKGKAIQARVAYDAMNSTDGLDLPITAFVRQEVGEEEDQGAMLYGGALGFGVSYGRLWAEFVAKSLGDVNTQAISVTVQPRVGDLFDLLVRYDLFDPNTDVDDDGSTTLIAGVEKSLAKKVSAAITFEQSESEADEEPTQGVFLRIQAGF
jgi:hypothetical protein